MSAAPIKATLYRKKNRSGSTSWAVRHGKDQDGRYQVKVFSPGQEPQARSFMEEWNRQMAAEDGNLHLLEEVHQHEIRLALKKLRGTGVGILKAVEFFLTHTTIKHSNVPFSTGVDNFLVSLKERQRSQEYIASIYSTTIKPFELHIKNKIITDITNQDVKTFLKSKKNWSTYTQHSHRRNLSTLFNYLIKEGYLNSNPSTGITLPRQVKSKVDFWKPHEVFVQMQSCLENKEFKALAAIVLAAFVGPRLREASKIKWQQISDLNAVEVLPSQAKTYKRRNINISKTASFWLSLIPPEIRDPNSRICSAGDITSVIKKLKKFLELQGHLERRIQNGFRQAFAAHHYAKHKDERTLSEIMGNSVQIIKESYCGLTTRKESEFYFHLLPRESYIEGLKQALNLKLWLNIPKTNPDWYYAYSKNSIAAIDLKKYKEYSLRRASETILDDSYGVDSYNVKLPRKTEDFLIKQFSFRRKYGFDPADKDEVYLVYETKQHLELELGDKLENISFLNKAPLRN